MTADTIRLSIDAPDIGARIAALSEAERDALPFGVIRVDDAGTVLFYSSSERAHSGLRIDPIGRNFFADIAPCLGTPALRQRIDSAMARGTLDLTIDEFMDLPSRATDVDMHIRMISAAGGGFWIFLQENG